MFIQESHVQKIFRGRGTWRISLRTGGSSFWYKQERPSGGTETARETLDGEHRKWKSYVSTCELSSANSFRLFRRIWGPCGRVALKIIEVYGENAKKSRKWETLVCSMLLSLCIADKYSLARDLTELAHLVAFYHHFEDMHVVISKKFIRRRRVSSCKFFIFNIIYISSYLNNEIRISRSVFSEFLYDLLYIISLYV